MSGNLVSVRKKKVPTLYEQDESKYAGPHRWQVQPWAKLARRALRQHAYTRWSDAAFSDVAVNGLAHLDEVEGPCLFIGNHTSHLDTLLVMEALPERFRYNLFFGAAQDRWFVKGRKKLVLKPWYQSLALGTFPILRGGGKRALSYAGWLLDQGQNVFVFPEGTRATSAALGDFKHGVSILALQHDVPVVPIYLSGLRALQPKGQREVTRGPAAATILPALRFAPGTGVDDATAQLFEAMNGEHLRQAGVPMVAPKAA